MNLKKSVSISNAMDDKKVADLARHLGITRVWLWQHLKDNNEKYIEQMAEFYDVSVFEFINRGK